MQRYICFMCVHINMKQSCIMKNVAMNIISNNKYLKAKHI